MEFAQHYALKLNDKLAVNILNNRKVANQEEVIHLSRFFWKMVDASIENTKNNIEFPWVESAEFLSEKIMYSISGYLESAGFSEEWEKISGEQDSKKAP